MQPALESRRTFERLKDLLRELFQLDRGDLDFGLYRIMNMKAAEIEAFLDRDLLPQVKTALAGVADEQRAALDAELARHIQSARDLKVDPDASPRVTELREQLSEATADAQAEADVYGHLANFFARYYNEGDFMSLRRYSSGGEPTYLIPYDGEEVKLHWANADQYYVKTTENYASYAFLAGEGDAAFRVRFEIAAADNEKDNIKEANGKQRRFVLAEDAVALDDEELVVRFEHRPLTEREKRDWPGNSARQQDRIDADTAAHILAAVERLDPARRLPLAAPAPTDADPERTLLAKHVGHYTAKNSFDYFIHKDLGGFLGRELDLYLKTDVLDLQDLALGDADRLRRALGRMRAVREIGDKLITFLAQLEDFQKRLWLKKKFVLETHWCVTLDRVPEALYPEVVANKAQWEEWEDLFAIDEIADGEGNDFLKANSYLVLDTRHFDCDFKDRLLTALSENSSLDEEIDGLLIDGDNLQAQNLLKMRYREQVQCVYIDPPFNTGLDGFLYKDGYFHSSWLAMMESRIRETDALLSRDGTLYVHIDYTEKERLKLLLDTYFSYITEIVWRIGWVSGYKSAAEKFIRNHDTIYQYGKTESPLFIKNYIPYSEDYRRRDGNIPSGKGYPIEDTWNCSEADQLHSIQIMSFSKEKVGNQALTQKNENLIARMIESSSRRGDVILDYFLGSGTTTAVAHKLGRRYIGVEAGEHFYSYSLPRMKRVLGGDPYGISSNAGWQGGGVFKYIRLESYEDTLDGLVVTPLAGDLLAENDPAMVEDYRLRYSLDAETVGSPCLLGRDFRDPFAYTLSVVRDGVRREAPVDLPETFNLLLGLRVESRRRLDGVLAIAGKDPQGQSCLILWRDLDETNNDALNRWVSRNRKVFPALDLIYANGDHTLNAVRRKKDAWEAVSIEPFFREMMFEVDA